jgi:hypothetical protein
LFDFDALFSQKLANFTGFLTVYAISLPLYLVGDAKITCMESLAKNDAESDKS